MSPFRRPTRFELSSAKARREHSEWLTQALYGLHPEAPSIPRRKYDPARGHYGFSKLTRTPAGRAWADAWWRRALGSIRLGTKPSGGRFGGGFGGRLG